MKTCYIYARTATLSSTKLANNSSKAIAYQISECQKYAEEHGYKVVESFKDIDSGNNYQRNALQQLLINCKKQAVDSVIIFRIDRLSRNVGDYQKVLAQLKGLGIELISISEGYLNDGIGSLIGGVYASLAQWEQERSKTR